MSGVISATLHRERGSTVTVMTETHPHARDAATEVVESDPQMIDEAMTTDDDDNTLSSAQWSLVMVLKLE